MGQETLGVILSGLMAVAGLVSVGLAVAIWREGRRYRAQEGRR